MNKNQVTIIRKDIDSGNEIKIIEWNVTDPAESVFAVVSPVKLK
ncbi:MULTISPECIES: hypothetical protein [Bacillaceae]